MEWVCLVIFIVKLRKGFLLFSYISTCLYPGISHHFELLTIWSGSNENDVQFHKCSSHLRCFYNILQGTYTFVLEILTTSAAVVWFVGTVESTGPPVNMPCVWPIKMSGHLILCLYRPVKICWQCTQVVWCKSTIKQDKFKCHIFTEKPKSKLTSNLNKLYIMQPDWGKGRGI